jgi:hypothetical protein
VPGAIPASPATVTTIVIVALDGPDVASEVSRLQTLARLTGQRLLEADEVSRKLRGVGADCDGATAATPGAGASNKGAAKDRDPALGAALCYRRTDEKALAAVLQSAYEAEGYFHDQKADELRQKVLDVYNREAQPSLRLLQITGESLLGRSSGSYAQGKEDEAAKWAREAMRRFGSATTVDPRRFSPPLQKLFTTARETVGQEVGTILTVHSNEAGHLWLEGNDLGAIEHTAVTRAVPGQYRLWLKAANDLLSLPYVVDVAQKPVEINIDPQLDHRLVLAKPTQVRCAGRECEDLLARLRVRLGVDQLVGIGYGPESTWRALVVTAQDGPRWVAASELGGSPFVPPVGAATTGVGGSSATAKPSGAAATRADGKTNGTTSLPATFWTRHKWQVISAAAGVVAVGTGLVLASMARGDRAQSSRANISETQAKAARAKADNEATAANVLYGAGTLGLGAAGVMWWFDW